MQGFATDAAALGKLMVELKKAVNEAHAVRDKLRVTLQALKKKCSAEEE